MGRLLPGLFAQAAQACQIEIFRLMCVAKPMRASHHFLAHGLKKCIWGATTHTISRTVVTSQCSVLPGLSYRAFTHLPGVLRVYHWGFGHCLGEAHIAFVGILYFVKYRSIIR